MIFVSKRAPRCWALVAVISMLSACATVQKGVDGIVSVFDQDTAKPAPKSGQPPATKVPTGDTPRTSSKPAASPSAAPARATSAEELLAEGIKKYEDARYPEAAELLKSSLGPGLRSRASHARAHKYLAFIHCISKREAACRQSFERAFAADPAFALTPAEAGHPQWGPVYRSVADAR
ncbi:TssQ family T6SS-associated lipoprotein [Methyloversatilis sp.]|uniref:TssQ family T6SS-associated lipoprotein n=1 Tax=Methyloversatilis sp. TaxID=2569862 RepID=UPI002732D9E7|nr:TssQ family T6SS-associated lipoprotein [Methyloversatilis sp.]MDP2869307.1 TssQ family T6SS-associated lipoprotein [Methyloversatilis sp.]MDP3456892.1 TssQ family T6SS-associated lipoprotein [Methyloversatilis sp.]MDP3580098.1 TssQ family T6SS-associated lipoprotein [Methyloversatilis sp.]